MTLAELVQLRRSQEQANSSRTRLEMRFGPRGGVKWTPILVRLPAHAVEALASCGPPAVIAREIIVRWATRYSKHARSTDAAE